ncbi:MAG TPA: hypothetical protein VG755_31660 [Nannocystaceae bacterium]|nr:hypothetical protein [Nannocystaceae bacterium]
MDPARGAQLWCPFEGRINPAMDEAEARSRDWMDAFGLTADARMRRRLGAARPAELAARAYPTAARDELALVTDWNAWLFVHDDVCDATELGRAPLLLQALHAELARAVRALPIGVDAPPLVAAFADLVVRLRARARSRWHTRLVAVVDDYLAACRREAAQRASGRVPRLSEYIDLRRDTGTVRMAEVVLEPCERIVLPESVREHPHVRALLDACTDVLGWANDVISVRAERSQGEVHNLVTVLEHQRAPHDGAHAMTLAMRMHDARVATFVRLAAALPRFGGALDGELGRYVDAMRWWMHGHLQWATGSARYAEFGAARDRSAAS